MVDQYRARLASEGRLAARTINKQLLILHAIFKRARRVYALPINPVAMRTSLYIAHRGL